MAKLIFLQLKGHQALTYLIMIIKERAPNSSISVIWKGQKSWYLGGLLG